MGARGLLPPLFRLCSNRVSCSYTGGRLLDEFSCVIPARDSCFAEDWLMTDPANGRSPRVELGGGTASLHTLCAEFSRFFFGHPANSEQPKSAGFELVLAESAQITSLHRYDAASDSPPACAVILGRRWESRSRFFLGAAPSAHSGELPVSESLNAVPVRPGDVIRLEPELPYAMDGGVMALFYYPIARGRSPSVAAINWTVFPPEELRRRCQIPWLSVAADGMRKRPAGSVSGLERWAITGSRQFPLGCFAVLLVASGSGRIIADDYVLELRMADRVIVPAAVSSLQLESSEGMTIYCATAPGDRY